MSLRRARLEILAAQFFKLSPIEDGYITNLAPQGASGGESVVLCAWREATSRHI